MTGNLKGM